MLLLYQLSDKDFYCMYFCSYSLVVLYEVKLKYMLLNGMIIVAFYFDFPPKTLQ